MAVQIFGRGVNGVICAEFKRALKGGREKRVVHRHFRACALRLVSKGRNIHDAH
jgi:hypothetical protein